MRHNMGLHAVTTAADNYGREGGQGSENVKTIIYARVSTDKQDADNQIAQLTSWVTSRGWELAGIYRENESAWKNGHQKELVRLMDDARKRRFEAVLVWALDRLSREGPLAILTFVNRLKSYGVKVLSYQESWTEAPGELGELLYAIAGWVAKMESQRRSERTKAGLARAIRAGKMLGRPKGSKDKRKRKRRKASF